MTLWQCRLGRLDRHVWSQRALQSSSASGSLGNKLPFSWLDLSDHFSFSKDILCAYGAFCTYIKSGFVLAALESYFWGKRVDLQQGNWRGGFWLVSWLQVGFVLTLVGSNNTLCLLCACISSCSLCVLGGCQNISVLQFCEHDGLSGRWHNGFVVEVSNRLSLVLVWCMAVLQSWERSLCSIDAPEQAGLQLIRITRMRVIVVQRGLFTETAAWPGD